MKRIKRLFIINLIFFIILSMSFNVHAKPKEKEKSSDSSLKSLEIEKYNIDFSSSKGNYVININDEDSLTIYATANDYKSKVTIEGNNNLKNNSIIKVKVIAEDKSATIYEIRVKKTSNFTYITIIVATIIIVLLIIFIIKKENLKSKYFKPKQKEEIEII